MKQQLEKYVQFLMPLGVALTAFVLVFSFIDHGSDWPLFFSAAARLSGRVSLLFFVLLFAYATLTARDRKSPEVRNRMFSFSMAFAIIHLIHWLLLMSSLLGNGHELMPARLAPGIAAYLIILILPLSFRNSSFTLSPVWEKFLLYYVGVIFLLTYVSRISGKSPHATGSMPSYIFFLAVVVLILTWSIVYRISDSKKIPG